MKCMRAGSHKRIADNLAKHKRIMDELIAQGVDRDDASEIAYVEVRRGKQWRVVDHNDETVFSYDTIRSEPAVVGGLYTAAVWAKRLARDCTDPEAPAPLRAIKD